MIDILLFAGYREQLGRDRLVWSELPITASDLKKRLEHRYQLPGMETVMVAVNEEFVKDETWIADGDTVVLIQPVSGG